MSTSEPHRWHQTDLLQNSFTPEVVLAGDDSSGLMLGREGSSVADRRAKALVVDASGSHEFSFDEPGWFVAGDRVGDHVAAAFATSGPLFWLVRSSDGGRNWSEPMPCSAGTVRRVAIVGDDVWAIGVQTLGRWSGGEWRSVPAPVQADPINDHMVGFGAVPVLITGSGLYLWSEEHQRWGNKPVGDRFIRAVSFPYFVSQRTGEPIAIGKFEGGEVTHVGELQFPARVLSFSTGTWPDSAANAMQMVVTPERPESSGAVVLVRSVQSGGFAMETISIPGPEWVGISGASGLLAMSVDRRIIQYR